MPQPLQTVDAMTDQIRPAMPEQDRAKAFVACGVLLLVFGFLALLARGEPGAWERALLLQFRDPANPARMLGPRWLPEMLRDITSLGSTVVLGLVVAIVASYLALGRKWADLALVLAATLGGQVVSTTAKLLVARARPDLIPGAPMVFTPSFPSGHALLSAVTYLTLGALLSQIEPRRGMKIFYIGAAVALTFVVGASRVALGVHWPTDVLAGWSVGAAWALLCGALAQRLRARRVLEPLV